ncbi:MAG: hypothetical protein WBW33_22430 [Bryobacteraceae bacterium]
MFQGRSTNVEKNLDTAGLAARTTSNIYFLNRLLKASRASVADRGVACGDTSGREPFWTLPLGNPSRATVTLGEKRLH